MKRNNTTKILLFTLTLLACGSLYRLSASHSSYPQIEDPSFNAVDSDVYTDPEYLHALMVDSLVEEGTASYKRVVEMIADGTDYSVIYPMLYQSYQANLEAFNEAEPKSTPWLKARGTLLNIDPLLEDAAIYYSSKGINDQTHKFAQAFVDIQLHEGMKGMKFKRDEAFPKIVYVAAVEPYGKKDYEKAIDYLDLYISTNDPTYRENTFIYLASAYGETKKYEQAIATLKNGLKEYPNNDKIGKLGIQLCRIGGHGEALQDFLDQVLATSPNDVNYLTLQAQLFEDAYKYNEAIDIYSRIDQLQPDMLSTAKRMGLCYYNIGASYTNEALNAENEKQARKSQSMAKRYFSSAVPKLEQVLANEPNNTKIMRALGTSYRFIGDQDKFNEINTQLAIYGEGGISESPTAGMMTYNEGNKKNFDYVIGDANYENAIDAPLFTEYSRNYIAQALAKWAKKGEFEKDSEYNLRVTDVTTKNQVARLKNEAAEKYIDTYGKKLRLSDLKLMPYDANNEAYQIESSYGSFTIKVPLKDGEAERFKSNWHAMTYRNAQYCIENDKVQIAALTIVSPDKRTYSFDRTNEVGYAQSNVNIDLDGILADFKNLTKENTPAASSSTGKEVTVTKKSDVDINIPRNNKTAPNTFALIIANENYTVGTEKVASALHDGEIFAEYCKNTLGIPEQNIRLLKDATSGRMKGEIKQFQNTISAFGGNAEAIVYYAGHGVPDEQTRDAYLLPVDGVSTMLETCISLKDFYKGLGDMNAQSVMVFLDACFSGTGRGDKMLASARGIALKPKDAAPEGNMFVLSAASGQETAYPYKEKNHGLFTYFLLKKLQESKGNVTLKELSDYVTSNVKQQSNIINKKQQTPSTMQSGRMVDLYKRKKLIP